MRSTWREFVLLPGVVAAMTVSALLLPAAPCQAQFTTGPTIVFMFPPGGQQGTTVEAIVAGNELLGATEVYVSGEGVTASVLPEDQQPEQRKGRPKYDESVPKPWSDPAMAQDLVGIKLEIAADAELGERDLRLITPGGPSTRIRFFAGDLPERVVTEVNATRETALALESLPVTVNGQLYSGWSGPFGSPDRGYYRFSATAGQTLVFEFHGRRLIPFVNQAVPGFLDACLTLYDTNGRRLAYADDFRFDPDPVLIYEVEKDGEYVLEVRDTIYRSMQDYVYRLRIGQLPYLTGVFPLGGKRGTDTKVALHGVDLPEESMQVSLGGDAPSVGDVQVQADGKTSPALPFAAGDLTEATENEPNDGPQAAQKVAMPLTINGRIDKDRDEDWFVFHVDEGQEITVAVHARRLGSPLDSVITLIGPDGAELAANDDHAQPQAVPAIATEDNSRTADPREALLLHHADAELTYACTEAGDYMVRLCDVREMGGEDYAYRLTIRPAQPGFVLRCETDKAVVTQGDSVLMPVSAMRLEGYDGPIALALNNAPDGFTISGGLIPPGQEATQMTLTVPQAAKPGLNFPTIVGTAEVNGRTITSEAFPCEKVIQAFYIAHLVPTKTCLLQVKDAAGFTLTTDQEPNQVLEVEQETDVEITVKATRFADGKGPITLAAESPDRNMRIKGATLAPNQDEATVTISVSNRVPPQHYGIIITGTMKAGKETTVRTAPAITLNVVEPKK